VTGHPVVSLTDYRTGPERLRVLVRRVASHDRRAFARLYDALAPMITTAVYDIVVDRLRAEAITAAVFLEVWRCADRHIAPGTDVVGWIAGLALQEAETTPTTEELRNRQGDGRTLAQLLQRRAVRSGP
jgi:RNA polymerase sigma-70 factor (ECF subfamily)